MPAIVKRLEMKMCSRLGWLMWCKNAGEMEMASWAQVFTGLSFHQAGGKVPGVLGLMDISEHHEDPCHMVPSSQGRSHHLTEHKEVREAEVKEERKEVTEGRRL